MVPTLLQYICVRTSKIPASRPVLYTHYLKYSVLLIVLCRYVRVLCRLIRPGELVTPSIWQAGPIRC